MEQFSALLRVGCRLSSDSRELSGLIVIGCKVKSVGKTYFGGGVTITVLYCCKEFVVVYTRLTKAVLTSIYRGLRADESDKNSGDKEASEFGWGTFFAPADLMLAHLALAMTPNLNLNLRKLFLFSFSFEENDKQKAEFSNEYPQQFS